MALYTPRIGRSASLILTLACLFVVAAVSVHDAMLLLLTDQVIAEVELNPMGRWLIKWDEGEVLLFVILKLIGTTTACALVVALFQRRPEIAFAVAASLAGFQVVLLSYLTL